MGASWAQTEATSTSIDVLAVCDQAVNLIDRLQLGLLSFLSLMLNSLRITLSSTVGRRDVSQCGSKCNTKYHAFSHKLPGYFP